VLDLKLGTNSAESVLQTIGTVAPGIPVVVVTAYPDAWTRITETKSAAHVSRVMLKPVDVDLVAEEVLRHCATSPTNAAFG